MTTYSMKQIAQYAYNAGFRGTALAQASAVAMAESSGVSDAVSSDGYGSVGLWQFIPSTWAAITGTQFSNASDPQQNANAAFKLWQQNGQSFAGQWSVWPGMAAPHLPAATVAAASITGNTDPGSGSASGTNTVSATGQSTGLFDWIGSAVKSLFQPLINYAIDAGMVVGGALLLLFGGKLLWDEAK